MDSIPEFKLLDNLLLIITKLDMNKNKLNDFYNTFDVDCKLILCLNLIF